MLRYLFIICTLVTAPAFGQGVSDSVQLEHSLLDIDDNEDYSSFALLDPVVGNYNVFFTGENHRFRTSNYMLQLKMLKYLHKQAGVRHLLLEFGYSRGYLVDMYVQTGDSAIYEALDDYSFKEYAKFYKALYEFNQTLDSANRIHIHGIDLERSPLTSVKLMEVLLPSKSTPVPDSIELSVETIRSLEAYGHGLYGMEDSDYFGGGYYSQKASLWGVMRDYDTHKDDFQDYLGDNFEKFDRIIRGLRAENERLEYEANAAMQAKIFREQYMYRSFLELIDSLEGERFFSQFGRCHTATEEQDSWCNFYHLKSLASRINGSEHPRLKDKVCSIAAYYPQDDLTWYLDEEKEEIEGIVSELSIKENGLTLVKAPGDTTVYPDLFSKFQYIIVNNNSLSEDFKSDGLDDGEDLYYYDPVFFDFNVGAGGKMFHRMGNISDALDQVGVTFSPYVLAYSYDFSVIQNRGFAMRVHFDWYDYLEDQELADGSLFEFRQLSAGITMGADILGSEKVNLVPYGGLSFGSMRMRYETTNQNSQPNPIFPGTTREEFIYRNGTVQFDVGLNLNFQLGETSSGIRAGYQLDISDRRWKLNGDFLEDATRSRASGPYVSIYLGVGADG